MKSKRSGIISLLIVTLTIAVVLFAVIQSNDMRQVVSALRSMNPVWLALGILCYAGYIWSESAGLWFFLRGYGYRLSLPSAAHLSFCGLFYSNLTPGATGGQPMQIYRMSQRGIPVGTGTSALVVRFFFNQLCWSVMCAVLFLFNRAFCAGQMGGVAFWIVLGWVINTAGVLLVLAAAFRREWLEKLGAALIRWLTKKHWQAKRETWTERFHQTMDQYEEPIRDLVGNPRQIILQLVTSLLETLFLALVPLTVYGALGLSGTPWYRLLTVSYLVFVSASYTPLPGASGAQEGGFMLYYRNLFPDSVISAALLTWRFITFYLSLILGALDTLWVHLRKSPGKFALHRHRKKESGLPDTDGEA